MAGRAWVNNFDPPTQKDSNLEAKKKMNVKRKKNTQKKMNVKRGKKTLKLDIDVSYLEAVDGNGSTFQR